MPEGRSDVFDHTVEVTTDTFFEVVKTVPVDISVQKDQVPYEKEKYLGGGGVYSNIELLRAIIDGHIVLYPFNPNRIQGTSIDFTLGEYFWRTDAEGNEDYYQFLLEDDITRYFQGPLHAIPNAEWAEKKGRMPFANIPKEHPIIVMRPGERILAHTHEFIGIKPPGTTEMKARSTIGRNGIVVCKDAGWGDPGYCIRWTMEIQNDNHESIALPVGFPVGQMVFYHTGEVAGSYTESGNYSSFKTLNDAILDWNPGMMLPKARPDQVVLPDDVEGVGTRAIPPEELARILMESLTDRRSRSAFATPSMSGPDAFSLIADQDERD